MRVKNFYLKYEHYFSPLALVSGFVWDNLTLKRVDFWLDILLLLAYLAVAAGSIVIINAGYANRFRFLPFILQFVFGGLFSAFVVFYLRSAPLVTSWPFLFCLAALLIGNELFRERYLRLAFHLSIFFVALFSFSVLIIPTLIGQIGAAVFILSGFASLVFFGLVLTVVFYVSKERVMQSRRMIFLSTGLIYVVFNVLYFFNIIPPIPLSLKEIGVYHSVKRVETGDYIVSREPASSYFVFRNFSTVFHRKRGEPVYVFSSVFAPAKINTVIFHRWSYFDEQKGEWIISSEINYSITGGRDGGYRGYTFKHNIAAGKWRVDVVTGRGQLLGRVNFTVVESDVSPEFVVSTR